MGKMQMNAPNLDLPFEVLFMDDDVWGTEKTPSTLGFQQQKYWEFDAGDDFRSSKFERILLGIAAAVTTSHSEQQQNHSRFGPKKQLFFRPHKGANKKKHS